MTYRDNDMASNEKQTYRKTRSGAMILEVKESIRKFTKGLSCFQKTSLLFT